MEEDATLPDHTIYRPRELAPFTGSQRLPIVAFSGPGCDFNGTAFRPFFTEVASHGYLVVVNGPPEPRGGSGPNFPRTKSADLLASVQWGFDEAARRDGKYFGRLDTTKVAVMGQSCGGLQTLEISGDPRITTLVLWNSGIIISRPSAPAVPRGLPATSKEMLRTLKVPIAYFVGGTDMARPNAADDFARIDTVPVFLGVLEIPGDAHAGTFREPNGGKFGVAGVAWLDWQLKGDEAAAVMFTGVHCGLCRDPQWQVQKKRIE
jgi:dienelactone hydrolase